jgi:anaerobic selenocysteine-containing dehydrogenase
MPATRDSIADVWGPRAPQVGADWPVRVDQNLDTNPDRWVQASCFLCSNGCGLDIGVKDDRPGGRIVGVRGRAVDVVNRGRLGPKGCIAGRSTQAPIAWHIHSSAVATSSSARAGTTRWR